MEKKRAKGQKQRKGLHEIPRPRIVGEGYVATLDFHRRVVIWETEAGEIEFMRFDKFEAGLFLADFFQSEAGQKAFEHYCRELEANGYPTDDLLDAYTVQHIGMAANLLAQFKAVFDKSKEKSAA